MKTDLFSLLFLLGLAALTLIRLPHARRSRQDTIVADRKDAQERWLIVAFTAGGLLLPVIYVFTPWLDFANYQLPRLLSWVGVAVMIPALYVFWRSHADLGRNWSPTLELRAEHSLITHGVYARIRHPMYAAAWLAMVAQALLLSNWVAGPAGLLAFGLMYVLRVPREEAMMLERFGEAYGRYMSRTGRLWPRGQG